jgi:phosphatidylserine decarboxylase
METKTQTQQCRQNQIDLRELTDKIREKLRSGVKLPDGSVVYLNPSVYHFTYAKVYGNRAEVVYVAGCVSTHVDVAVNGVDIEISNIRLYNLCNSDYGV